MRATMHGYVDRWLKQSTARERWLLIAGGAAVLIWIVFALVWQPMQVRRDAVSRQIALY